MRVACLVFAKPPVPGRAKTRLAAALGDDGAAAVAAGLLRDTMDALADERDLDVVLATPEPEVDHGIGPVSAWDQGSGDLGARLERSLRRALGRFDVALAIGADSPHVPPCTWGDALRALRDHDAVLGPTEDGGFYLLGLRSCPEGLLHGLPWSSERTFEATLARLVARGWSVATLPRGWDVDRPEDLERFRREVPRGRAPATHAALDAARRGT